MGFDQSNIDDLLKEAGLGSSAAAAADSSGSVDDILNSAGSGESTSSSSSIVDASGARPAAFDSFDMGAPTQGKAAGDIEALLGDVQLRVEVVLGTSKMSVEDILKLGSGSVIELNKLAGDPLDVLVNDKLVAKGEVLVLNENFCIRITDIVPPDERK